MQRPLSRRKYAALVRFYRSVLNDSKATTKLKMQAAQRLDDLYARHEAAELRREEREARAQAAATAPAPEPETESIPDPEDALRRAKEFLARTTGGSNH